MSKEDYATRIDNLYKSLKTQITFLDIIIENYQKTFSEYDGIIIYCAGNHGLITADTLTDSNKRKACLVDSNEDKQNKTFCGLTCYGIDKIERDTK